MARIFTTPEAAQKAKSILHDITLMGGLRSNNIKGSTRHFSSSYISAAEKICDELVNRDFTDIDSAIRNVSVYGYEPIGGGKRWFRFKPEAIAKAIVYMAELTNLYWDDTIRTPYEVEAFKKTLLGDAVYKYGRYLSVLNNVQTTKASANTSAGGGGATAAKVPQNGYKSSGPQSGNVRDLQGNPGDKVTANTNLVYKIVADKVGKNTPNVFIKPLSSSGATGNTNKIFFSSGNGYTDCTCYFDDPNDAKAFLDKIVSAGRVPSNINNPYVAKAKADPNGYFLVGTEFGVVAVSAKTLNESITVAEDLNNGWSKATKEFTTDQLEEFHEWMHRN